MHVDQDVSIDNNKEITNLDTRTVGSIPVPIVIKQKSIASELIVTANQANVMVVDVSND